MRLHTRFGAVGILLCNQIAVIVRCRDLTVARLPSRKVGNLIGASRLGVIPTAGALIVILPAVHGAGRALTIELSAASVGVRDGSVVSADVAGGVGRIGVIVCAYLCLLSMLRDR